MLEREYEINENLYTIERTLNALYGMYGVNIPEEVDKKIKELLKLLSKHVYPEDYKYKDKEYVDSKFIFKAQYNNI